MDEFKGKWVMVTGAGSGIGKSISLKFAQEGANLILNDLPTQSNLKNVKTEVEKFGAQCVLKYGDVSNSKDVDSFFKGLEHLDVLINNAGFLEETAIFEMTDTHWDRMMKVNLYGVFYCSREATKQMIKQGSGHIINITSDLGQLGAEKMAHYSASKGGIISFTKSLARELASHGILVNGVAPGATLTPLVEKLGPTYILEESIRYPLRRLGLPEEVAGVVCFLASRASSFMTGQIIGVNGGGVMNG